MMKVTKASTALTLTSLHYLKQRIVIIIIGAILSTVGFFAAITIGTIVISDIANSKVTPQDILQHSF